MVRAAQSYKYTGLANLIDDFGGPGSTVARTSAARSPNREIFSQNYFVQDTYRPFRPSASTWASATSTTAPPSTQPELRSPAIDPANPACWPLAAGATCNTKQTADKSNWGPRAGIAWSPTFLGQNKTVIRCGFGVFYDVVFTNIIDNIQSSAPNAASPVITSSSTANGSRGTSNWSGQFANLSTTPDPTDFADPIVNHLLSPRTMHWNLNIEQELPWATTLQVGYVGERGTHLFGNSNVNPFVGQYEFADRVIPDRGRSSFATTRMIPSTPACGLSLITNSITHSSSALRTLWDAPSTMAPKSSPPPISPLISSAAMELRAAPRTGVLQPTITAIASF